MENNKPQSLFLITLIVTSSCPNGYKKCAMQFSPFKNNVETGKI